MGALTSKPYAFKARPWELTRLPSVDFFDCLGSTISLDVRGSELLRITPRESTVNEEWISDKVRFAYDGLRYQRLSQPLLRTARGSYRPLAWERALRLLAARFRRAKGLVLAPGPYLDLETAARIRKMTVLKARIYLASPVPYVRPRQSYSPQWLVALASAPALTLAYLDPRLESPIFHLRLRREVVGRGLRVLSLGPRLTLAFPHLALGSDPATLARFLFGRLPQGRFLVRTGLGPIFASDHFLASAPGPYLERLLGLLAQRLGSAGYYRLGSVGASSLAFHGLFGRRSHLRTARTVLWNLAAEEAPDPAAFGFSVYQGPHGDGAAARSTLLLPSCHPLERDTSILTLGGALARTTPVATPPGQARLDWAILLALRRIQGGCLVRLRPYSPLSRGGEHRSHFHPLPPGPAHDLVRAPALSWAAHPLQDPYGSDVLTRFSRTLALASARFTGPRSNFH
jgi:NADH-quinone oxidoreductase subunit G